MRYARRTKAAIVCAASAMWKSATHASSGTAAATITGLAVVEPDHLRAQEVDRAADDGGG
jgi:hypothetical protein